MRFNNFILMLLFSLPTFAAVPLAHRHLNTGPVSNSDNSPVLITKSPYTYGETITNLKKAIGGKNFRLIRMQTIDQGFVDKQRESSDMILYFCNYHMLNHALQIDKRIGQFLPCRITVIQRQGQVYLLAINPRVMGQQLSNNELKATCHQVTEMYKEIMDEATI